MEINDLYQNTPEQIIAPSSEDVNTMKLRNIHINVENIYDELKNVRSANFYKVIFFFLFSVSAVAFILHIFKYKFSFGAIFLVLLVLYYFYYNFRIKQSLKINIKSKTPEKIEPEKPDFLRQRITYIGEGLNMTLDRSRETKMFFMIFFPLLIFTIIDIIKGPMDDLSYVISIILSISFGASVWYYYFKLDNHSIKEDIDQLLEEKKLLEDA